MIERGRSGAMHAPRLFAHGDHALPRCFRRGEVDVRQLGESVAHRVVDGALADLAAFDVGDGDAQSERRRGRGQHLVAIGDEQKQIGPPRGEGIGQAKNGQADRLGHTGVGVGVEQALDARLDGKAVALDFLERVAELGREMGPESEDAEFDFRVSCQLAQGPVEMAVVGARGGDDADAAARGRSAPVRCIQGLLHRRSINCGCAGTVFATRSRSAVWRLARVNWRVPRRGGELHS